MELLATTENFQVYASTTTSGTQHMAYCGGHNYLSLNRVVGSTATSVTMVFGDYTSTYLLSSGSVTIDITSLCKIYEGTTASVTIDGTTISIACAYGIDPTDFAKLVYKPSVQCIFTDMDRTGGGILLPSTIIQGAGFAPIYQSLPATMNFEGVHPELSSGVLTISPSTTQIRFENDDEEQIGLIKLQEQDPSRSYVMLSCTSPIGIDADASFLTPRKLRCVMELMSYKVEQTITDLQTHGNEYKYKNEGAWQITIGIRNISAYDYGYYSQILMAEDIEVSGWGRCEPVTKTIEINTGSVGKYDFKITLKARNYVTI